MKTYYLIPLLFLSACSTAPKLTLRPQQPPADISAVRYPEIINAYHVGRYVDPGDDLVMHEQHTVYRVEENTRWDFHPGTDLHPTTMGNNAATVPVTCDAAFSPAPVNDAILAEVNSQRLATAQIMLQAHTLSAALAQFQSALQQTRTNLQQTAALHVTVNEMKQRLDALESAQGQSSSLPVNNLSTTNEPPDPLSP
jgi:hypothetical protein